MVPICLGFGLLVESGFFFPSIVGAFIDGRGWLVVSLAFFGSGLSYLALLPSDPDDGPENATLPHPVVIRRMARLKRVSEFLSRQDPVVFGVPVLVLVAYLSARVVLPDLTTGAVGAVESVLLRQFDWLFLGVMVVCVLYCLFLLVGPWGDIRLGGPDAEPTYTYPTYFAMFFTAGIAAGIVFWGPAEALFHYQSVPPFFDADAGSPATITGALTYALFHWGFSAWTAYLVVGLPIAYFVYHRGAPLRVSTLLTPFLGVDGLDDWPAKLVDVLAIFATIGGLATSIALVSNQFLAGIDYQWGVSTGGLEPALFVAGLTAIYVIAAESGVRRGIRRIAAVNILLFVLFAVLLFAVGPRSFVIDRGTAAVESYLVNFVPMSLFMGPDWVANWTVWNWSWWFSWAPFAGLFLAAISKGRRLRTVVVTGVGATTAASGAWFLLLGGTSLYLQHNGVADILGAVGDGSVAVAGYPMFEALPLGQLFMFLMLALIVSFIVTSADVSTLVVSILATERGRSPTTGSIAFWGVFQGLVAVAVLLLGGGTSLQALAVLTGGPFAVVALIAIAGLTKTFWADERGRDHRSLPTIARELFDRYALVDVAAYPDLDSGLDPRAPSETDTEGESEGEKH